MTAPSASMRRLDMRHPIIRAPFAGGSDTPALVAAVGEAVQLGTAFLNCDEAGTPGSPP